MPDDILDEGLDAAFNDLMLEAKPFTIAAPPPGPKSVIERKPGNGQVYAAMTTPRLAFSDFMHSAIVALTQNQISYTRTTGAFWGQCVTRSIEDAIKSGAEYVLTLDYDTIFEAKDVARLVATMKRHPRLDALAALQMHRHDNRPLLSMKDEAGNPIPLQTEWLGLEILPVSSAHFGMTIFRADAFAKMPKPWMVAKPNKDGDWHEGKQDDDEVFWDQWVGCGNTVAVAPHVSVGHLELVIRWPVGSLACGIQPAPEYWKSGKPKETAR